MESNITSMLAPNDTLDAMMASRMMSPLSSVPAGASFDRQFMGAEVMMHRPLIRGQRAAGRGLRMLPSAPNPQPATFYV